MHMIKNCLLWILNGIIFVIIVGLFIDNHVPISAFEHQYYLWKDVVFGILVIEHAFSIFFTYKYLSSIDEIKFSRFLMMFGFWALGIIIVILLSRSK